MHGQSRGGKEEQEYRGPYGSTWGEAGSSQDTWIRAPSVRRGLGFPNLEVTAAPNPLPQKTKTKVVLSHA